MLVLEPLEHMYSPFISKLQIQINALSVPAVNFPGPQKSSNPNFPMKPVFGSTAWHRETLAMT